MAVGGNCEDAIICTPAGFKLPMVRVYLDSTRAKVWSKYIKKDKDYDVHSIAFS